MTYRRFCAAFALAMLVLVSTVLAETLFPGQTAVPKELLNGSTLSLPTGSMDAPAGWSWSQLLVGNKTVYVCTPDSGELTFVQVIAANDELDLKSVVDSFCRGFTKNALPDGTYSLVPSESSVPFPGSLDAGLAFSDKSGRVLMRGRALAGKNDVQTLVVIGIGADPPDQQVQQMVKSYHPDEPGPGELMLKKMVGIGNGVLGLLLLVLLSGPRTKLKMSGALLVIGLLALVCYAASFRGPEEVASTLGGVTGGAIGGAVVLLIRRAIKRPTRD
jgi:hypothetical protein